MWTQRPPEAIAPTEFPANGDIQAGTFPYLLLSLCRHGATGSLKVTGPVHPKALYFRGGRILFGSSNDPRDQLGAILTKRGRITREQLDEVNAKVGPGNPVAKVLAESGYINQSELNDAAREKVERILGLVLPTRRVPARSSRRSTPSPRPSTWTRRRTPTSTAASARRTRRLPALAELKRTGGGAGRAEHLRRSSQARFDRPERVG